MRNTRLFRKNRRRIHASWAKKPDAEYTSDATLASSGILSQEFLGNVEGDLGL